MSKLTPWFPGDVNPARPGLYQRDYYFHDARQVPDYFDGTTWFYSQDDAKHGCAFAAGNQCRRWRGLAQPPKGTK